MKLDIEKMSPEQIRKTGIEALTKSMGTVGMTLFLRQFDMGSGDWTRERHAVLKEKSVGEIVSKIKQARKKKMTNSNVPSKIRSNRKSDA